ncbi:nucleotidyl transferase AbiEii/AbiGii toxin family protein [Candidatus Roizmanbacteria bacterium]|nr:nucleotidyl transferase AbiEii/AbiGii toxin family protein [Candidatus Roizmanbacteria bacterium]
MVNINLHKSTLVMVLRSVYSDPILRNVLGFKGGTAAYLFYGLPRFSVDLDFDLFDPEKKQMVFERLKQTLPQFGNLIEAKEKRYTLFFLLSYQKGERTLKVEVSKRPSKSKFEPKNFLGIPMLVMLKNDMATGKLLALITRKKLATRDLFDLWFFLKNNWQINNKLIKDTVDFTVMKALKEAENKVKSVKKTSLLAGLGDLLDNKQKSWVKNHLQNELLFLLKLQQNIYGDIRVNNY